MVKITGNYQGGLRCQATHGPSGATLETDAPVDNHGLGEAFSPTDLLATATMTCMATILGIKSESMGLDLSGMQMSVTKEMSSESPRRVARLTLRFEIPVEPGERDREMLERAAHACPVHQSLSREVAQDVTFVWGVAER